MTAAVLAVVTLWIGYLAGMGRLQQTCTAPGDVTATDAVRPVDTRPAVVTSHSPPGLGRAA
ncbi:hypothetical protein O4160_03445 [Rhodococcus sp. IEGM 1401]|uniref:hypothetical protein n=1 Tax=unclassified Rhodococcus (in: high G+C Gram-positive bacteria) TaxID=192944 RepID=UPI0022B2C6B7|nr:MULTISPECIES: hypothetical protein [unclassified Rhodococcus (in: high G+C Gram-positive bacteria)]MCZ4559886.1 hypothetical protein [Rhodococcus sp. IEGM 1401]MDI9920070.1 hypothetical protein [Rhodococcus sp. IEGM 1372]MDV8032467.1 hypothetical protein [Rhodococcus sp. IEGM 1414]